MRWAIEILANNGSRRRLLLHHDYDTADSASREAENVADREFTEEDESWWIVPIHHLLILPFELRNVKSNHPLHETWWGMINRCYNQNRNNYRYYGGRGIQVDESWFDFNNFCKDMGARPNGYTLDRIFNDDYCKDNCRWVSVAEQRVNRSRFEGTLNKYKGVSKYHNKWKSEIRHNGKLYYLGLFPSEMEAALAYDNKMKEFYPDTYKLYVNIKEQKC